MKKILLFGIVLLLTSVQFLFSQNIGDLNGIYYQAVAIDDEGKEIVGIDIEAKPLYEKNIGVRFTITSGPDGDIQWEETHTTTTDKYGLFSLIIGQGEPTGNSAYERMLDIPWIDADQFLKVEISTKNDGNYKLVSNQAFMSVPYSFYTDDIADLAVDLTTKVSNILPVANGGTGTSSLTDGGLLVGGGTDPVRSLEQGTDGQIPVGVSASDPVMKLLAAGIGISITNNPDSIIITSTFTGVNSNANTSVNPGNIPATDYWLSPAFVIQQPEGLDPIEMGDILIASADVNMEGCLMNVYLTDVNNGVAHARVSIFNPTASNINLGNGVNIKILVVK